MYILFSFHFLYQAGQPSFDSSYVNLSYTDLISQEEQLPSWLIESPTESSPLSQLIDQSIAGTSLATHGRSLQCMLGYVAESTNFLESFLFFISNKYYVSLHYVLD